MKITLLAIGKTDSEYLKNGIEEYTKRIKHYIGFEIEIIQDIRKQGNLSLLMQKEREGEMILAKEKPGREIHLFDENGQQQTSREFSVFLEKKMVSGIKELVFVVGGPYGFSEKVYSKANSKISLSKLTFSHQMVRLLCVEQIYRAFTILNGEPYHHD